MEKNIVFCVLFSLLVSCKPSSNKTENWIQLFNGKDLTGWEMKITGYELNNNYLNTFRVEDSVIKVSYDGYEKFNGEFGHLFYKTPYSSYILRLEYRFTGEQSKGGPEWAFRNSGVMFHAQDPSSMEKDQSFPVCIEAQFLGGNGKDERTTANVCTPGTHIAMNGQLITEHCINSSSKTFQGDQWVKFELIVYSDSIIHHLVNGDTVFTYSKPQISDTVNIKGQPWLPGMPLKEGYIALQAESHPVEFRKIELLDLSKK